MLLLTDPPVTFSELAVTVLLFQAADFLLKLLLLWRRRCLARWSLRIKRRWQTLQTNFLSPVCVRRWRERSSDLAKLLIHPCHPQTNGFSPAKDKRMSEIDKNPKMASCNKILLYENYVKIKSGHSVMNLLLDGECLKVWRIDLGCHVKPTCHVTHPGIQSSRTTWGQAMFECYLTNADINHWV